MASGTLAVAVVVAAFTVGRYITSRNVSRNTRACSVLVMEHFIRR